MEPVTLDAVTFVLSDSQTGRVLGHALICSKARYASIAWLGSNDIDRRFANVADWQLFEFELLQQFPPTPFKSADMVARILLPEDRRRTVSIQYVERLPVAAPHVNDAPTVLDGTLRALTQA